MVVLMDSGRKRLLGLVIVLAVVIYAVSVGLTRTSGEIVSKNITVVGCFGAEKTFEFGSQVLSVNVSGDPIIKVSANAEGKKVKVILAPGSVKGYATKYSGTELITVRTKDKVYAIRANVTIYTPYVEFVQSEKPVEIFSNQTYVVYKLEVPDYVQNFTLSISSLKGNAVKGYELKGDKLIIYLDPKKLEYIGETPVTLFGTVKFKIGGVGVCTTSLNKQLSIYYVNYAQFKIPSGEPIRVISPVYEYYDVEAGKYVYAFKARNFANTSLVLSVNNGCISTYPIYYGAFPECWKAIIYSVYQRIYSTVGGTSPGACSYGCAMLGCSSEYPIAGGTVSFVYYVTDKPVDKLSVLVRTTDGFTIQKLNLTNFEQVDYFPTFAVNRTWDIVSKYMPIVVATGSDGATFSPLLITMSHMFIASPLPETVTYRLTLFAIVPNAEYKGVTFKVLAPSLGEVRVAKGDPVEKMGENYTVFTAEVEFNGQALGLLPIDIIVFVGGKPAMVEHTYLTPLNLGKSPVALPTIRFGNTTRVVDFNALEVVKFWGYGVALLRSNETVLTKGGYIMKNDASITLRLENVNLKTPDDEAIPDATPYKLFNITTALKIMFYGKPTSLDAVGIYLKSGNITADKRVPVQPLAMTIQPKYATIQMVTKDPAEYVNVYQTIINGSIMTVVSNPTPYTLSVNGATVEPFSIGVFKDVRQITILGTGKTIELSGVSRPLKLVPSNYTVERLKNSVETTTSNNYTIVEIPFTVGSTFPSVKVSVSYNGKEEAVRIVPHSVAMMTIKQILGGNPANPVAYYTVFNQRVVLNVVIPGKPDEFSINILADGKKYTIEYSGLVAKAVEELGVYDIPPIPNFNAYYITSFRPVYFVPAPYNPYHEKS